MSFTLTTSCRCFRKSLNRSYLFRYTFTLQSSDSTQFGGSRTGSSMTLLDTRLLNLFTSIHSALDVTEFGQEIYDCDRQYSDNATITSVAMAGLPNNQEINE